MKKIAVLLLSAMLFLVACSASAASMNISPAQFSEETESILNVVGGGDLEFFDISLDESAKSYEIIAYVCTNGVWSESGKVMGAVQESDFQIGVEITNNSFTYYKIDDSGHTKSHYPDLAIDFSNVLATGGTKLQGETAIVLNEEIPLYIKIGTDDNGIPIYDINEGFEVYDSEIGIAITIKVSDKVIE